MRGGVGLLTRRAGAALADSGLLTAGEPFEGIGVAQIHILFMPTPVQATTQAVSDDGMADASCRWWRLQPEDDLPIGITLRGTR